MGGGGSNQVQETPAQVALAERAKYMMDDYRQRWLPVQQHLAGQITRTGAEGSAERKQAAGLAASSTEQKFDAAVPKLTQGLTAQGVNMGSSRAKLAVAGLGTDKAFSKGVGTTISDQHIDDAYTQGLSALMAQGRGERVTANHGLANIAGMSGQQAAQDAQIALADKAGRAELGATAVGMGLQQYLKPGGLRTSGENVDDYRGTTLPNSLRGMNDYGG